MEKEKRAIKAYPSDQGDHISPLIDLALCSGRRQGYIQGATDQQKIDIEKAWDFIVRHVDATCVETFGRVWYGNRAFTKTDFIKAMEE